MRPNGSGTSHHAGMNGSGRANGANEPSMEEILAFLRGTLAEEQQNAVARGAAAPITLAARTAATETAGRAPQSPDATAANAAAAAAAAAASGAAAVRQGAPEAKPAATPAPAVTAAQAIPASQPAPTPLKPVSMPFMDTRFSRLSANKPAPPAEVVAEATVVTPPQVDQSDAPASGDLSSLASVRAPAAAKQVPSANAWPIAPNPARAAASPHWTTAKMSTGLPPAAACVPTPAEATMPPPVPASVPAVIDAEFNTVESAAADLLRPVLRQWLSDNMPRIVERALRIEMTEGAPPPVQPRREK